MLQIKNTLGGGKPEGLYVWKKSSLNTVEKATSTNATTKLSDATNATITYYTSSSYTFDEATGLFALDNPTEATLPYGSSKSMSNNIYFIVGSPSGETMFKGTSSNTQLRNNSNGLLVAPYSSSYTYTVYTAEQEATFLDYVVSDKETAYPDGGEKDGYWYERVVDGVDLKSIFNLTDIAVDVFTPASDLDSPNIPHSLGKVPKVALIVARYGDITSSYRNQIALYGSITEFSMGSGTRLSYLNGYDYLNPYTNSADWDSSKIIPRSSSSNSLFASGVKYTLITMA